MSHPESTSASQDLDACFFTFCWPPAVSPLVNQWASEDDSHLLQGFEPSQGRQPTSSDWPIWGYKGSGPGPNLGPFRRAIAVGLASSLLPLCHQTSSSQPNTAALGCSQILFLRGPSRFPPPRYFCPQISKLSVCFLAATPRGGPRKQMLTRDFCSFLFLFYFVHFVDTQKGLEGWQVRHIVHHQLQIFWR